jgi:alpha-mannosidase
MSLNGEWRKRVQHWVDALPRGFYRSLGTVEMPGFLTMDQLTPEQAASGDFQAMPSGTRWGSKWEYAWFRGEVELPAEADGLRIAFDFQGGGTEAMIFVNGRAAGSKGWPRQPITLARKGKAGEKFSLLAEAYGGHGPTPCAVGPVAHGQRSIPEPAETQQEIGASTFGVWQEDAYQLWLDVTTLLELRDNLDANSLRVAEIDQALCDFTLEADPELPNDEMLASYRTAREHLRPLMECVNGSTAPTLFAFGHAHLDVAWLWPLAETERKAARTLANQLALAEEYEGYSFLHSQTHLFRMVRDRYPALYQRVKDAVAKGQVIAEGGMWVEADTNVTGGESLIRQFVHGKRFFRDEFGVDCELLWLPDVFGYTGALPQILAGCGIKYFSTQKIFWAYKGGEIFPHNTFRWEGIDGSEVLVHLHNDYNSEMSPKHVIERWDDRVQKDGISTRLMPFGWGDGGGGPTRDHLEYTRREKDLEGCPRVKLAGPIEYFKDLEQRGAGDIRYVGELYFQAHRGTYTSQARTKRGNRKGELALREAEAWSVAASALAKWNIPVDELDAAWKKVLLNHFHDILPGSSIARVYAEAEAAYAEVLDTTDSVTASATGALTDESRGLTVFNSLSWPRTALVELPEHFPAARDASGENVCVQAMDGKLLGEVEVPACGWASVTPADRPDCGGACQTGVTASASGMENDLLRVELNDFGEITSLFDKEAGRELATGTCNALKLYKDVPGNFDAWDLDSFYMKAPVALKEKARIEVVSAGPLVACVRVHRKVNQSELTQEIILRRGSRRVDFRTVVDWNERHKVLKVAFPVDYHADEATHEIQFGHIQRPTHYSRPFDADRYEVCNHKWSALVETGRGFAVLNDCKYGLNVLGNCINLTLLRAPMAPDPEADQGKQEFTYAIYAWNGAFLESDVVREAYDLNCPVTTASGAADTASLLSVDAPNVIVETIKPAEDGSGDIVVRLYESKRTATRCTLSTSLPVKVASLTDMLEAGGQDVACESGRVPLEFGPFEVKTLRLAL